MSEQPKRPHPSPHPRPDGDDHDGSDEHGKPKRGSSTAIPNWLFYTVVLLVLGLWAGALVLTFISPASFEMPASLNGAVPVVLVGLFGSKAAADHKNESGRDDQ